MRNVLLITLLFFVKNVVAQNYYSDKLSAEALKEDLKMLHEVLAKNHPGLYDFQSPEEWTSYTAKLTKSIKSDTSRADFYKLVADVITHIKCGHTILEPGEDFQKHLRYNGRLFPFQVSIYDNEVYVKYNLSDHASIKTGSRIDSINGMSLAAILPQLKQFISVNGHENPRKKILLEHHFSYYFALCFGEFSFFEITTLNPHTGQNGTIIVQGDNKANLDAIQNIRYPESFIRDLPLSMEISSKLSTCIVDIETFNHHTMQQAGINFVSSIDSIFRVIEEQHIAHLIIDLRKNNGGARAYVNHLLSHLIESDKEASGVAYIASKRPLIDKCDQEIKTYLKGKKTPFRKNKWVLSNGFTSQVITAKKPMFRGHIYVMVGPETFSAGTHVASFLKRERNAILVGETCGGFANYSNAGYYFSFLLPNSKFLIKVPYVQNWYFPDKEQGHDLLQPSVFITPHLQDYLQNKDTVLLKTLEVIHSQK